jgi:hypothetical protein
MTRRADKEDHMTFSWALSVEQTLHEASIALSTVDTCNAADVKISARRRDKRDGALNCQAKGLSLIFLIAVGDSIA